MRRMLVRCSSVLLHWNLRWQLRLVVCISLVLGLGLVLVVSKAAIGTKTTAVQCNTLGWTLLKDELCLVASYVSLFTSY